MRGSFVKGVVNGRKGLTGESGHGVGGQSVEDRAKGYPAGNGPTSASDWKAKKGTSRTGKKIEQVGQGATGKNGNTGIHVGGMHFFRKKCIFVKLNKNLLIT